MRMLAVLVAVLGFAGCTSGELGPSNVEGSQDPDIRTPPADNAVGCGAVTAAGVCEAQQAVFCDVQANVIRKIDCAATGQTCEVDAARGAGCASNSPTPPPDTCGKVSFFGECNGSVARWCEGGQVKELDCGASQLTCATEVCFAGAACCTTTQIQTECQTLGVYGACGGPKGNDVRWCDSNGTIHTIDCGATSKTCKLDGCGYGAQCC